ncbi:MAG TPA: L-threonylcarbamoyladenylate synthase [Micromonosporaceae bacterium]|jgi:tRNA threonylcarbamoyl adenosine modification protein (Sua5/YciO/YrdC/YwlC family)
MLFDCGRAAERDRGVKAAIDAVQRGDLVVMPTDTVYGIGADAFKSWAVTALQNAKGRGRGVPPPVLVGSRTTVDGLTHALPQIARDLMEAFWPGGLTIVVQEAASLSWDLGDKAGTVALRMPLHPIALEVLRETGPMAVSSANTHGKPPAATALEAREQLGYSVSVYLDGGVLPDSEPSTIIDVTGEVPTVLRPGAVSIEALRKVAPNTRDAE